jgi:dTDP-4-amino-4,6-dideoxy-D-galactose acyltransferase
MNGADSGQGVPEVLELLEWDSAFFGRRIARARLERLTPGTAAALDESAAAQAVDCLYLLTASDDPQTARLAEDHGYRFTDIRLTFEAQLKATPPAPLHALRPARANDLPDLRVIAAGSYGLSRFYYDACFPRERCDALYATWIERSVGGWADSVLVAELPDSQGLPSTDRPYNPGNGLIGGFISCHLRDTPDTGDTGTKRGEIGLVGVAEAARGQNVGGSLVSGALAWFAEHGAASVSVVTQGRNVAAQRLYQRGGFLTRSVQLWYHKWFGNCQGGG